MKRTMQTLAVAALVASAQVALSAQPTIPQSVDDNPTMAFRWTYADRALRGANPWSGYSFPANVDDSPRMTVRQTYAERHANDGKLTVTGVFPMSAEEVAALRPPVAGERPSRLALQMLQTR